MPVFLYGSKRNIAAIGMLAALTAALAICLAPLPAFAGEPSGDEEEQIDFDALANVFRKHCVRVYVNGKSHAGKTPSVGDFASDIGNERPTLLGGYWWDDRHVIVEDPVIHDRYIRSVEIGLPFSDHRYPARVAGRFVKIPALLIEVLPGEGGLLPQAFPLEFADGDPEEAPALSYVWDNGEWRIRGDMWHGPVAVTDSGKQTMELGATGVMFSEEGVAFGLAFGDRIDTGGDSCDWSGAEVRRSPILTADEAETFRRRYQDRLASSVLETRFHLRVRIDDDDEEDNTWIGLDDEDSAGATEIKAAGLVVGPKHLFVPLQLNAEAIARIEDITVAAPDGKELNARFVGACREYMAVVLETEEELPAHNPPRGFAMLNPLIVPDESFQPRDPAAAGLDREYFHRWRVDYALGRRRETVDYDRWLGTFRGFRGDSTVLTETNEEDGALALDVHGNLVAVALTPRVMPDRSEDSDMIRPSTGFRPLGFIHKQLQSPEVFDASMAPVDEEEGKRLVDLGVEYQGLDANTSRLFHAATETRGGKIGMLVTYVYPGSPAAAIGLREHDVLLRLFLDGKTEPVELRADDTTSGATFDFEDMSAEAIQQTLAMMPPPWPPRDNNLSKILTAAGVGRGARLDYLREGELKQASFVTAYSDPDYRNAPKDKYKALGFTVKPITYEVARFFRRDDKAGVIVSKVEEGGKASVAGMHPYLLITRVDNHKVEGPADFRRRVEGFEKGGQGTIELTVEAFGKTRLVKVEQRNP